MPDSDVDLLVDLAPGTGLLGLAALERDLAEILEAKVDVVPASDLNPGIAGEVLDEAVPLCAGATGNDSTTSGQRWTPSTTT